MRGVSAGNSPDNSIRSLAEFLGDGVALVNYKVLVKDLEYFASLEIRHGCACGSCCVKWPWISEACGGEEGFKSALSRCGLGAFRGTVQCCRELVLGPRPGSTETQDSIAGPELRSVQC